MCADCAGIDRLVTLGSPHNPPPEGVLDQTRGILTNVAASSPGNFHQEVGWDMTHCSHCIADCLPSCLLCSVLGECRVQVLRILFVAMLKDCERMNPSATNNYTWLSTCPCGH